MICKSTKLFPDIKLLSLLITMSSLVVISLNEIIILGSFTNAAMLCDIGKGSECLIV